jgi:hypothetical protein
VCNPVRVYESHVAVPQFESVKPAARGMRLLVSGQHGKREDGKGGCNRRQKNAGASFNFAPP